MNRLLAIAFGSVLIAGSVAAGALAFDAIDEDSGIGSSSEEVSLPELEVPVIPADDPAFDDGGRGPSIDPASVLQVPAPGDDSPTLEEAPELDDLPPLLDAGEDAPAGFEDPCADGEGEGCDGVGATVLGTEEDVPLQIVAVAGGVCDLGPDAQVRHTPFMIVSNVPADFDVFVNNHPEGFGSVPVSSGSDPTPESEVTRWLAAGRATFVGTCVGVPLPSRPSHYEVEVQGRAGDSVDTFFTTFDVPPTNRPPVIVEAGSPSEHNVRVTIPAKSGADTGVAAYVNDTICDRDLTSTELLPTRAIPAETLEAADYPYDPAYDHRALTVFDGFRASDRDFLCIGWIEDGAVVEREQRQLAPPNRYRMRVHVERIDFLRRRVPSQYSVHLFDDQCQITLAGNASVRSRNYADETDSFGRSVGLPGGGGGCDRPALDRLPGDSYMLNPTQVNIEVEVRGPGATSQSFIAVPFNPCTPGPEPVCETEPSEHRFRVPLSVITGLCGSGTGGGCDPPTSRIATVTVLVRLFPSPGVRGAPSGGPYWVTGVPTSWDPS